MIIPLLWLQLFSSSFTFVDAEAHPHQGKVAPFVAGDPKVKLDRKAIHILESGRPYSTQIQSGSSGRGLVVQDVEAPTDIVWDRILDYNNYANMVPKTLESQNYKVETHRDGSSQTIYTKMKVGFGIIKLTFYVKHLYLPKQNSLTWTLDYTKKSDFDDSCGYWYVVPHPNNPMHTRVYYSVQVSMFDWVPQFVVNFMSNKALTDATGWVKKFSEQKYNAERKKQTHAASALPEQTKIFQKWVSKVKKRKHDEEETDEDDEKEVALLRKSPTALGWKRYALVTSVFCLSVWNVHLYFSQ